MGESSLATSPETYSKTAATLYGSFSVPEPVGSITTFSSPEGLMISPKGEGTSSQLVNVKAIVANAIR